MKRETELGTKPLSSLARGGRLHFWLGILLVCAIGIGLFVPTFVFVRKGHDSWTMAALGVSLTSFLSAYLLASFRRAAQVERLVVERTAELAEANRRFRELGRLKDEFVAHVSHELRTPMGIVREGISQVLEELCGKITQEQKGTLSVALRNVDRLGSLIEDLLDISKIEAGKLAVRKGYFDLGHLVREISLAFGSRAKDKGLGMKIRFPDEKVVGVYADREKVAQVFNNLVDNAIKFAVKGFIEISVEEKNGAVYCQVSDTGPGIAKEYLPKVFEKFQQFSRAAGPGSKGTGLGLAICKGIVELHGGRIWVESVPGRGTSFTFTLPRYEIVRNEQMKGQAA